jgi:hypothetical protein
MHRNIFTEEANYIRKLLNFPWILFIFSLFFIAFLLSICGCDKGESLKEQAIVKMWKQCRDILSMTYDKGEYLISEYGLVSDWNFSGNCIELMCTNGFFFLFDVESSFSNKNNNELKIKFDGLIEIGINTEGLD